MTPALRSVSSRTATLVVPCFNENARLTRAPFVEIVAEDPDLSLLFVDDGSTDATNRSLSAMCEGHPSQMAVHTLPANAGKGEAVRLGLLRALASGTAIVGFVDADLATPISEIRRLLAIMRERTDTEVLLAARVALLGRDIKRRRIRHYVGRVFATVASALLRVGVYDTQCGAKLFRAGDKLAAALADPFVSRWIFDVELIGRMLVGKPPAIPPLSASRFIEEPLLIWHDVAGSKLRARQMLGAASDLARVGLDLQRRKTEARRAAALSSS